MPLETFRYDLASPNEPRIILITDLDGKRSELPRLGYVVVPHRAKRELKKANPALRRTYYDLCTRQSLSWLRACLTHPNPSMRSRHIALIRLAIRNRT